MTAVMLHVCVRERETADCPSVVLVILCLQTIYYKQNSERVVLLAVSPRCWRYHHAAGGITTPLAVSPRRWRYHHAAGGITTLLAVSSRCSLNSSTLTVTVSLFSQQPHSHSHSVAVTPVLRLSLRAETKLAVGYESWTLLSCLNSTPSEVLLGLKV